MVSRPRCGGHLSQRDKPPEYVARRVGVGGHSQRSGRQVSLRCLRFELHSDSLLSWHPFFVSSILAKPPTAAIPLLSTSPIRTSTARNRTLLPRKAG